jgi:hypothetical protein
MSCTVDGTAPCDREICLNPVFFTTNGVLLGRAFG